MYTGTAQITLELVDDILQSADLFQLDDLKKLCFQYLSSNLSASNCLIVANLAQKYNCGDVRSEAENVIVSNFKMVISSNAFPGITRSDLLRYIAKVDYETSWAAAITWVKNKDEFPQLFQSMDIKKFPFIFLWKTVLEEPLVKQTESVKNKVIKKLFSNPKDLEDNVTLENCVLFKNLADEHGVSGSTVQGITNFMRENFDDLTTRPEFMDLAKDDLLNLLQSPETKCSSDTVKYDAILKWVKHDLRQRKKFFPDVFGMVKLEELSMAYLKDHVSSESLVEESRKCCKRLMDALFTKGQELEKKVSDGNKQESSSADAMLFDPDPTELLVFEAGGNNKIEVDKDIFAFMLLTMKDEMDRLWNSCGVKVNATEIGDYTRIEFVPAKEAKMPYRPDAAIDRFHKMYNSVNDKAHQDTLDLGKLSKFFSKEKVASALGKVKAFHKRVHISQMLVDEDQILFIAETKERCESAKNIFKALLESF